MPRFLLRLFGIQVLSLDVMPDEVDEPEDLDPDLSEFLTHLTLVDTPFGFAIDPLADKFMYEDEDEEE